MLTLALASDDGRTECRKRCSDPHEVETLSAAVRGGSEVDECDRILSVMNDGPHLLLKHQHLDCI